MDEKHAKKAIEDLLNANPIWGRQEDDQAANARAGFDGANTQAGFDGANTQAGFDGANTQAGFDGANTQAGFGASK